MLKNLLYIIFLKKDFIYVVIRIIAILITITVAMYNTMKKKQNNVSNAFSSLDVVLKRRYDLIPNLVSCVKAYMIHEKETLENITMLRSEGLKNSTNTFEINNEIDSNLKNIFLLSEAYPDLKANENFTKLYVVMVDIEEHISAARRTYNAHVTNYNNFIQIIPNNIFAMLFQFKKAKLFDINENERESRVWLNEDK